MKYLFIDSNVYINCGLERVKGSDLKILDNILKKLDEKKVVLLLPENIEAETISGLKDEFKKLKKQVGDKILPDNQADKKNDSNNSKVSNIIREALFKAKALAIKHIEEKAEETIRVVSEIFKNKSTQKIKVTNSILLNGIRRSSLKVAPSQTEQASKGVFLRDQDCIACESLIFHLKKGKKRIDSLIFCIDDIDYYEDKEKSKLKDEIEKDFEKFTPRLVAYDDPLKMLNIEFDQDYSPADVTSYKEASKVVLADHFTYDNKSNAFVRLSDRDELTSLNTIASFVEVDSISNRPRYCPNCGCPLHRNWVDTTFSIHEYVNEVDNRIFCPRCYREIKY